MPNTVTLSERSPQTSPDYVGLVSFLVKPFLESPESLSVDCEHIKNKQRVWIRLAFEGTDLGRVFGRGGRNIQAIRTVLKAAAALAGQSLYLDVYGSQDSAPPPSRDNSLSRQDGAKKPISRRSAPSKPLKASSEPEAN